nr:vegetative cell wall protein gp1-like [Aegilops tauschii subsp. strangulata]
MSIATVRPLPGRHVYPPPSPTARRRQGPPSPSPARPSPSGPGRARAPPPFAILRHRSPEVPAAMPCVAASALRRRSPDPAAGASPGTHPSPPTAPLQISVARASPGRTPPRPAALRRAAPVSYSATVPRRRPAPPPHPSSALPDPASPRPDPATPGPDPPPVDQAELAGAPFAAAVAGPALTHRRDGSDPGRPHSPI